ncbi:uncharacterized protein LOC143040751 isoform X2 [Oratosquilla oratoria]|uniref:uncharacterized protein LOC143040751 isoform X2 n=1 Tax=Oratosquilla oratoria TaxID=337810 RepID=UPI003F75BE5C
MRTLVTVLCLAATALAGQYNRRSYIGNPNGTEPCLAFKTCTTDQARWSLPYPICGEGRCVQESNGVVRERIVYCPFPQTNDQCTWVNQNQASFGPFPDCCPRFSCPAGVQLVYPEHNDEALVSSVDGIRAAAQHFHCSGLPKPTPPPGAEVPPPPPPLTEPKVPAPQNFPDLVVYI